MILFLVFSDWYNTNDVILTTEDGKKISANVRLATQDVLDIREYRPDGRLAAEVERAIALSGMAADLEKVEKIEEIMRYGIMATPGLVINEEVKASGRVPLCDEIVSWIRATAKSAG